MKRPHRDYHRTLRFLAPTKRLDHLVHPANDLAAEGRTIRCSDHLGRSAYRW